VVAVLLSLLTLYAIMYLFFRLLNWADSEPPEVRPVPGLCGCKVDPFAGVAGHCSHKAYRIHYLPKHAFN